MFQDAYTKLDKKKTKTLLEKIVPFFEGVSFDPLSTVVMKRALPFYEDTEFFDIADYKTMPPARRFVVMHGGQPSILDFTAETFHGLNERAGLKLNRDNVADYVRFFLSFVRGRHGRFQLVETVDDISFREEPPPTTRKTIGKLIAPLSFADAEEPYRLDACLLYKVGLYKAVIVVQSDGRVEIRDEDILIEDIPVVDDTLGQ